MREREIINTSLCKRIVETEYYNDYNDRRSSHSVSLNSDDYEESLSGSQKDKISDDIDGKRSGYEPSESQATPDNNLVLGVDSQIQISFLVLPPNDTDSAPPLNTIEEPLNQTFYK